MEYRRGLKEKGYGLREELMPGQERFRSARRGEITGERSLLNSGILTLLGFLKQKLNSPPFFLLGVLGLRRLFAFWATGAEVDRLTSVPESCDFLVCDFLVAFPILKPGLVWLKSAGALTYEATQDNGRPHP